MQVGKASWIGKTFALARCSDSQGKKPRSRRTKEERRKMVESFIKRHRDSNNGNFPSLNLTHKEVGGSFYTVREIVREIIQENKVLRPGSLNSQAFNLDDCSEQHLPEPFSSDYLYNLSLTTMEHSSDERKKGASDCNVNQNVDEVLSDHGSTNTKEEFALHSHDILVPQEIDGDSHEEQHYKIWHSNVDSTNEKSSKKLIELSAQGQNYLPTQSDEELCVEDKVNRGENFAKCETDDPIGFSQPLSISSTVGVSIAKDVKSDMKVDDTNKVIYSFVERENASKVSYVCDKLGNLSSSGHAGGLSPRHAGELHTLHSTDSTVSGSEQTPVENGVLDTSGLTEAGVIASKNVSSMPVYSDSVLNSMESLSSTPVDRKAGMSVEAPITDLTDRPTYDSTNLQVETVESPLISSNGLHTEVVTSMSRRASREPGLENPISNSDAGEKSTLDGISRESSEAREKMENTEANPLLTIIKGLVTAFIKFWTE